ncbi:MAG: hypothetical protein ACKVQA_19380, partial [Burkholderiales bacterium]
TLNMVDEGFRKTAKNGVEISTLGAEESLLSFYSPVDPNKVQWSIGYGDDIEVETGGEAIDGMRKRLVFDTGDSLDHPPTMSLDPRGYVGIGNSRPQHALDVNGVVRLTGRIGGYRAEASGTSNAEDPEDYEESPVPADGKWHSITGWLGGCQAFEVMAGAGEKDKGRYALLHAIALNTFNPRRTLWDLIWPKKKIRACEAYYDNRGDRIELRWDGSSDRNARYRLQIRTRNAYGPNVRIQYYVTQLWFDADMSVSRGESRP